MKLRFIVAALILALPVIVLAQVAATSTSPATSTSDDSTVASATDATSTPDTSNASSTNITSDTSGTSTSDVSATSSTDTESVTSAATSTSIIASSTASSATSSVSFPPQESTVPAPSSSVDVQGIASAEQTYHQQTGHYLQVIPGDQLPSYESGTVSADLGADIPDTVRVDIYEAPGGDGYQISYEENGVFYSSANGPEASSRTYTIQPPAPPETATSTASTTSAQ